jgi:hypothetical protein
MPSSYILGYGGKWQQSFRDPDVAVRVAEGLAEAGVVVEVVRKRFGLHSFFTAFPESEREALRSRWRILPLWSFGDSGGTGGNLSHHHHHAYNSIASFGNHGAFGGHHHGGGHGH